MDWVEGQREALHVDRRPQRRPLETMGGDGIEEVLNGDVGDDKGPLFSDDFLGRHGGLTKRNNTIGQAYKKAGNKTTLNWQLFFWGIFNGVIPLG